MVREFRYEPHYVKTGSSNFRASNRSAIAQFVLTADGDGVARLRVFDASAGSGSINATNDERLTMRALRHVTVTTIGAAMQFGTGVSVSLSGTGARCTVYIKAQSGG